MDVRLTKAAKEKLQAAAFSSHRTLSDFVMESALARADETLADRRLFLLDEEKWLAFQTALDAPVRTLPRLRKLLTEPAFFDSGQRDE